MRCNFIRFHFITVFWVFILFSGGAFVCAQELDFDAAIQSSEDSTFVTQSNDAGSYVSDKDISAKIQKQVKLLDERRIKFHQTETELLKERKTEIDQTNQLKQRINFRIEQKKVIARKKNKLWFGDEQFSIPKSLDTLVLNQYAYPDYMESVRKKVIRPQIYFKWVYDSTSDVKKVDLTKNEQRNTLLHLQTRRARKTAFSDVLFPHKTHTYWLNCISCHPAPFEEKVGATTGLTMAENYRSKFCGKCHGTVAFSTKVPLRQCLLCHIDTRSFRTAIERGKNYEIAH